MSGKYDIDRDLGLRGLELDTPTTEEFQAAHIDELKRQLAEKDAEIASFKEAWELERDWRYKLGSEIERLIIFVEYYDKWVSGSIGRDTVTSARHALNDGGMNTVKTEGINLRLESFNRDGRHPQIIMKDLGITYQLATPQSMLDCWWFWNCKNVPDELPEYINELRDGYGQTMTPSSVIGYGLSKKQADMLENGYNED